MFSTANPSYLSTQFMGTLQTVPDCNTIVFNVIDIYFNVVPRGNLNAGTSCLYLYILSTGISNFVIDISYFLEPWKIYRPIIPVSIGKSYHLYNFTMHDDNFKDQISLLAANLKNVSHNKAKIRNKHSDYANNPVSHTNGTYPS